MSPRLAQLLLLWLLLTLVQILAVNLESVEQLLLLLLGQLPTAGLLHEGLLHEAASLAPSRSSASSRRQSHRSTHRCAGYRSVRKSKTPVGAWRAAAA
jgi:hypothetical protein